jgi:hypothetical protein
VNPYTGKPGTKDPEPYGAAQALQAPTIQPIRPIQPVQPQQQPANPYALPHPSPNRF